MRRRRERWAVGVDLGGTWVRVVAYSEGGGRRALRAAAPGLAGLPRFLRQLWRRWGFDRRRVTALLVASRGVWLAAEARAEERRLAGLARQVGVLSDAAAAYQGALADRPGVLLVAGTGSIALARDGRGRWGRAGGLGPLLGDEGSAFWIGREWVRAAGPGLARARRLARAPDAVARIAALAPAVLRRARRGHPAARRVVAGAQAALAGLVAQAARQARLRLPLTVSWAGSLLDDARFRAGVWRAARRRGLRIRPEPPRSAPAAALARLAAGQMP